MVLETTVRFMRALLGYTGPLDIGYRYDARDGLYKVHDVNPRLGAMFRLFVGDNGMDVARAIYRDINRAAGAGLVHQDRPQVDPGIRRRDLRFSLYCLSGTVRIRLI